MGRASLDLATLGLKVRAGRIQGSSWFPEIGLDWTYIPTAGQALRALAGSCSHVVVTNVTPRIPGAFVCLPSLGSDLLLRIAGGLLTVTGLSI